jgi:hypothetical protein
MTQMFERIVESLLSEAMRRGEFRGLAGAGKPIDLTAYIETPDDVRAAYALLKNAGVMPPEVQVRQQIEALEHKLAEAASLDERTTMAREIRALELRSSLLMEGMHGR